MGQAIKYLLSSFDNSTVGASARKLTAFVTVSMIVYCHFRFVDSVNVVEVLMIDCGFVLSLLGLTTWESITKSKNNEHDSLNSQPNGNETGD